ncbi:MAG: hypothetical protein OXM62_07225 [bacterium]|nr:hypothetical protein [bacterium]
MDRVKGGFGWASSLTGTYARSVWAGDDLPETGTPDNLFITSDKLSGAASTEPLVWPEFPATAPTVTSSGGCTWTAVSVRSQWRELHMWSFADRLKIQNVVPSFITRWNNLTAAQQNELRDAHSHRVSSFPDCPLTTADPQADCSFYLAHPAVWEWALMVEFETSGGGTLETKWETVASGVSYIVRLIDYADHQWTDTE